MTVGWHRRLTPFLNDPNMKLHLVSNFSRVLADDDLDALLRFDNIQVSFDSANFAIVRKLRSKAHLGTIIYNIMQLKARRRKAGYGPTITVNCTLCRETIGGLDALARLCVETGVDRLMLGEAMLLTQNNKKMPDTLDNLAEDEVILLANQLILVQDILRDAEIQLHVRDTLQARIAEIIEQLREGRPIAGALPHFSHMKARSACRQPWEEPFVSADGKVFACCVGIFANAPVGDLRLGSLREIVNGEKYRAVRSSILEGAPILPCAECLLASPATFAEFKAEIMQWQGDNSAVSPGGGAPLVTASWPGIFNRQTEPVLLENVTLEQGSGQAFLLETETSGYHRVFIDLPEAKRLKLVVTPNGRRNLRLDFTRGAEVVGRAIARLFAQPRSDIEIGAFDCRISRAPTNSYIVDFAVPTEAQPSQLNIFLMRGDGAVVYAGDHRCGIQMELQCQPA